MSGSSVEIHEFSTGITPERTSDGGWVSRGFTGRYMNSTLEEIPHVVERSIANKEFAVAEGASSDRPTIIGRVLGPWSVIALVTKGRDEKGRGASFYRYFLTQDSDGLSKIVAWISDIHAKGGELVFNPYDQKRLGQPNKVSSPYQSVASLRREKIGSTPLVLRPRTDYSVQQVNKFAQDAAQENGQPVSWAFNVEALEQAARFQIIYPASEGAIVRIQQSLAAGIATQSSEIDEQAIQSAIKNLMNSSQIKPDSIQTLAESFSAIRTVLGDVEADSFWNNVFDGQGAGKALRQNIASPQMSRLLTIRAMLMPETILEFLNWLQISDLHQPTTQAVASLSLQSQISRTDISSLEELLFSGLENILESFFREDISDDSVNWLLGSGGSVWAALVSEFLSRIRSDLKVLTTSRKLNSIYQLEGKLWDEIRQKIIISVQRPTKNANDQYIRLAVLFSNLEAIDLAACFYQVGSGEVPDRTYQSAKNSGFIQSDRMSGEAKILGIHILKEKTIGDGFQSFLNHQFTKHVLFPVLVLFFLGAGAFVWVDKAGLIRTADKIAGENNSQTDAKQRSNRESNFPGKTEIILSDRVSQDLNDKINEIIGSEEFEKNFTETQSAIKQIVQDLRKDKDIMRLFPPENGEDKILSAIQSEMLEALAINTSNPRITEREKALLSYDFFTAQNLPSQFDPLQLQGLKKNWAAAIYFYQDNNFRQKRLTSKPAGYIKNKGATSAILVKDIKERLMSQSNVNSPVIPPENPLPDQPGSPQNEKIPTQSPPFLGR
jgi:hypothetical protein